MKFHVLSKNIETSIEACRERGTFLRMRVQREELLKFVVLFHFTSTSVARRIGATDSSLKQYGGSGMCRF